MTRHFTPEQTHYATPLPIRELVKAGYTALTCSTKAVAWGEIEKACLFSPVTPTHGNRWRSWALWNAHGRRGRGA
ncbi:g8346 [Coccomyxa viridis]|uniref:G8346 protein n=1 Tax=Coccomyxa viridis TaxID=1274662 RepID=A0ABP1G2R6_9CHLO